MHTSSRFLALAMAIALVTSSFGCGSDADDGGAVTESPNLGDATEMAITAADGGEVELEDAGVKLSIPAGALASDETITAEVISKKDLPKAESLLGNVVEFGPDGLKFELPVTLELDLSGATVPKNADVSIAWYDADAKKWMDLPGSKLKDGKVSAETTHFTIFAVRFVVQSDGKIVQEGGMCPATFQACGGELEGTWKIVSGCGKFPSLGNADEECVGASASIGLDITGDVVIGAETITGTLETTSVATQILPKTCTGGMCRDPKEADGATVVDKGDTCEISKMESSTLELDESYTLDGSSLVIMDATDPEPPTDTTTFCVTGDTLVVNTLQENGSTIRWTAKRQ